jgi:hypothetical protein
MSTRITIVCMTLAVLTLACSHDAKPPAPPPVQHGVCFTPRAPSLFTAPMRPHDWLKVLVQLELGRGGVYATRDCTGHAIRYRPPETCAHDPADDAQPRLATISQEAVLERDLGGDAHLIWIITHRFDDGDGFGPIAIVHQKRDGLDVEALGALRLRTERVNMERWTIKNDSVVVASGEVCTRVGKEPGCRRSVRLLMQRGSGLIDAPVLDTSGRCMQEASFELARQEERALPSGLQRTYQLTSNVSHDSRYVVVEERLVVRDTDPNSPLLPAREVQRVETNRFIHAHAGKLVTRQRSLWTNAVETAAAPTDAYPSVGQR